MTGPSSGLAEPNVKQIFQRILASPAQQARAVLVFLALVEIIILIAGPDAHAARAKIKSFASHGSDTPWEADVDLGIHLAAWIDLALLILLAALAPLWTRAFSDSSFVIRHSSFPLSFPRWFWPLVLIAIALGTAARLPLASKSLWWDETWVIRQCSHGSWKPDKKDAEAMQFTSTTWKRCAFYYQKPTNHVPMSLAQKASFTAWRALTGAPQSEFSDLAARVPSLIASVMAIGLLACLLRRWGAPGAGVVAAVLLALHPWHIRYGADARAYALVVPLCISALYAATCLIETRGRRLRHWVWLGVNQFLWLWAFPNALFDVIVMFIVLAFLLLKQEADKADRWTLLLRLMAAHVFAAMLLVQMFLPNFMQARHWAGKEADEHSLDATLAVQTWQQIAVGVIPGDLDLTGFSADAVKHLRDSHEMIPGIASRATVPITFVAAFGVLVLLVRRRKHGLLVLGLIVSGFLFAGITLFAQSYFYPRFAIALLVPFIIGLAWTTTQLGARPWNAALRSLIIVIALAAYVVVAQPIRNVLGSAPYAPLRDVAGFLEKQALPTTAPVLCYGLGGEALPVYFPRAIKVSSAADIEVHLQRARAEKRTLHLVQGYNTFNRAVFADGFRLMDDPKVFKEIAWFPSIDPEFYFRVLRAEPAATPGATR